MAEYSGVDKEAKRREIHEATSTHLSDWDPMTDAFQGKAFNNYFEPKYDSNFREKYTVAEGSQALHQSVSPSKAESNKVNLYIGNIPLTLSRDGLKSLLSRAAQVNSLSILPSKDPERGTTYGFASVSSAKDAESVIEAFHNYSFGTRHRLRVKLAMSDEERERQRERQREDGYVPSHHFGFGTTYKEGTERAVAKFKRKDDQRKSEILDLNAKAAMAPPLKLSATYPPPDVSHPGTNLRYATAYYGKKFSDHRDFTESPIPGYTGFVPKKQEHELGSTYGNWSGKAYVDALATKRRQEDSSTWSIELKRSLPSLSKTGSYGNVYKPIGMVPKYTGYVPGGRFEISNTYGDMTRLLPVCKDTFGYSLGRYNHPGPPIKREVIPA